MKPCPSPPFPTTNGKRRRSFRICSKFSESLPSSSSTTRGILNPLKVEVTSCSLWEGLCEPDLETKRRKRSPRRILSLNFPRLKPQTLQLQSTNGFPNQFTSSRNLKN